MDGFDVLITGKVFFVECQNAFNAVYPHCGYQPRIVNLNAGNVMRNEQFAPFPVDRQTVRQQSQSIFKQFRTAVGFHGSKPVSIPIERTGASIPELRKVLRGVAKHGAALKDEIDRGNYEGVIVIIRLYPAKQNVAVNQLRRACHLAAVPVETLSGKRLGR
jgi:hypothetical protein